MRSSVPVALAVAFSVLVLVGVRVVQAQGLIPDDYGIADTSFHYISAEEFQETSRGYYRLDSDGFWVASTNPLHFHHVAPLRLPSGALVDGYTVIYDDSDAVDDLTLELFRHYVGGFGATGTVQIGTTFTSSGSPGVRSTWVDLDPDITIDYHIAATSSTQSYVFKLQLQLTPDLRFRGVIVRWKRQVSPAPASATFSDVPTNHWAFQHVEALVDSGITSGCGGSTYCPDQPVTRAQMAVFLSKALGLHWAP